MQHEFHESLQKSREMARDIPWWSVYKKAFPTLLSMAEHDLPGWAQTAGIDRTLVLRGGRVITVDEKVRKEDWPDFLLEYWSVFVDDPARCKPGWVAKNLACDFLAYAFQPSRRCYMLPFLSLRRAWDQHGVEWVRKYRPRYADNPGYQTISVPVPIDEVLEALGQATLIRWEP